MLRAIQNYLMEIKPVYLDGFIYIGMATTGVNAAMLSSDNAAKYIDPMWLFYLLWINGIADAVLLSIKMYRSTSFADHKEEKRKEGETIHLRKTFQPTPPTNP